MRLGIFGGTFSPPHKGHTEAAAAFCREMKLDKLLIIPTFIPPHKETFDDTTPEDRLKMCEIAFSAIDIAEVSDLEIRRGGKSYTYLTLEELSSPDCELFFLCGTDMILTFDLWKRYEYIFSLATICYARRENEIENNKKIEEKIGQYRELGAKIVEIKHKVTEISSSEIRDSLAEFAEDYLSYGVSSYIYENGLYGVAFSKKEITELRGAVANRLSEKRFAHTLGVEEAAAEIAKTVAPELLPKARVAALLHDITKETSSRALIEKYGIVLSNDDIASPETLHALTAVPYIKEHFSQFADEDIISAIKVHTTGAPDMTLLAKIIFVADYIEAGRQYDSSKRLREWLLSRLSLAKSKEEARGALDEAVILSIDYTLSHLEASGKLVHGMTRLTRDSLTQKKALPKKE